MCYGLRVRAEQWKIEASEATRRVKRGDKEDGTSDRSIKDEEGSDRGGSKNIKG